MNASRIVVVTPVLSDWPSLKQLIQELSQLEILRDAVVQVVAVDDGSTDFDAPGPDLLHGPIRGIEIVRLKANLGHQRAIALGLGHAMRTQEFDFALVMDSDGEDRPIDAARLIEVHERNPDDIVVAQRGRRSEGITFRLFYQFYKFLFRMLTGKAISFGNFSLVPSSRMNNVLYNPGIWNNFAATLLRCRVPIQFVTTSRGNRYFGSSKMNFTSLMLHGMSAVSVFGDIVTGRIILGLVLLTGVFVLGVGAMFYLKYATQILVPGYATNVILFLSTILINAMTVGFLSILTLLSSRSQFGGQIDSYVESLVGSIYTVAPPKRA